MSDHNPFALQPIRSLRAGDDLNDRRILNHEAGAATPGVAPSTARDGDATRNSRWIHLYFVVTGAAPNFSVTPWYYSKVSEAWHIGDPINNITNDQAIQIEANGEDRIFFQVTARVAVPDTLQMWAGVNSY